jgi:hypothetical protein
VVVFFFFFEGGCEYVHREECARVREQIKVGRCEKYLRICRARDKFELAEWDWEREGFALKAIREMQNYERTRRMKVR